jgi:hypothetical protein
MVANSGATALRCEANSRCRNDLRWPGRARGTARGLWGSILAALATFGCNATALRDAKDWGGKIQDLPGGGVLVVNPHRGLWRSDATCRLEPDLQIGVDEGGDGVTFGRISAVQVDRKGRVYVFDGSASELRVFGPDGALVRHLGSRGAGPNEFRAVIGMSLSPDDHLWIVDGVNARYTVVHEDGTRSYPRRITLYNLPWLGGFGPDGRFYDSSILPSERREVLIAIEPDGRPGDTVHVASPDLDVPRRGSMTFPIPFGPRVIRFLDSRGFVWTGTSHQYRLLQASLRGDTLKIITRPVSPSPLTPAQQDSVRRYVAELEAAMGLRVTGSQAPSSAPLISAFFTDDQGHLWVALDGGRVNASFDIFDVEGRYLGQCQGPHGIVEEVRPIVRGGAFYGAVERTSGAWVVIRAKVHFPE